MNNIGKMLDRLKTLATQSSSETFTGDRSVLNKEYQTLVNEIDRQAQGIGLSNGGRFAQSMGVYVGGGTTAGGNADTGNGTITLDLSNSVVDTKALGLRTSQFTVQGATGTNLAAAASTSVGNIVSVNGDTATFKISGPNFSSTAISVNLSTSDTTQSVADKLNAAIQAAGNAGSKASDSLRNAHIMASAVTDSNGNEQLSFTSASSAFQVDAATNTANALLGNFDSSAANAAAGASVNQTVSGSVLTDLGGTNSAENVSLKIFVDGVETNLTVDLKANSVTGLDTGHVDTAATSGSVLYAVTHSAEYGTLTAAGVHAQMSSDNKLQFVGDSNQSIEVQAAGDVNNYLGAGAWSGARVTGADASAAADTEAATVTVTVNGVAKALTVNKTSGDTVQQMFDNMTLDTDYAGAGGLASLGVTARLVTTATGSAIQFVGDNNQNISVASAGDTGDKLGLVTTTSTRTTAAASSASDSATVGFSINGGQKILVSFKSGTNLTETQANFQAAIDHNTELKAAGLTVDSNVNVTAAAGVMFRINVEAQTGSLDLGYGAAPSAVSTATLMGIDKAAALASAGASQTGLGTNNDVFAFAGLKNIGNGGAGADQQVLSFSANDANGTLQSTSVTLSATNAYDVDKAVETINKGLQNSGNATLKNIVAVKETNAAGTAQGIRFISSLNNFSVNVGPAVNNTAETPVGLYDGTTGAPASQGISVASSASGAIDISTSAGAKQAVIVLGGAVQKLGSAQAAIGKGQNQLGYAINLANSQISNFSSAQAQIRDADVASEAANLSKAQVLQQASIAAMAQANSAPQAVLSLLKG